MSAYVNHAQIRSWNQPVLSNEGKVSCSRKQRGPLIGLELTTDRYPLITSQTRYPLRHIASSLLVLVFASSVYCKYVSLYNYTTILILYILHDVHKQAVTCITRLLL